MSWPLFKALIKRNWPMWAIFTAVSVVYIALIVLTKQLMADVVENIAHEGSEMESFRDMSILQYTSSSFFLGIITIFLMVYYVMLSNKLVHKAADNTSMGAYLTAPISRTKYISTAAMFLLTSIFALYLLVFATGAICMASVEQYNMADYLKIVSLSMFCAMAIAMVSFFASSFWAGSKLGFGLLIGLPIALYVLYMLSDITKALNFLRYVTPFGWLEMLKMTAEFKFWWLADLGYVAITGIMFLLSVVFFKKKQLSI